MSEDTAIKSALRRSLHFNINSGNIGRMSDKSYYKFFIYNTTDFLEVEIMGGDILSARYSGNKGNSVTINLSGNYDLGIEGFTPSVVDIEYSFGTFTLSSDSFTATKSQTINAGESKYYGTLVSDASKLVSTLEVKDLDLGADSILQVKKIKLGKWIIGNTGDNIVNIIYKDDDTVTYGG